MRKARKPWSCKGIMSRRYTAQRGRCYLCNGRMAMGMSQSNMPCVASRDHVFPRATRKSNYDHTRNILLSHRKCNSEKGDREPYPCEILFLEIINSILLGYERDDDPKYNMTDWTPIPLDAKANREPPYDGKSYDIWFKGRFWTGYRETDIEWYDDLWCDRDGNIVEVAPGMEETHYMIPPTSPIYGQQNEKDN